MYHILFSCQFMKSFLPPEWLSDIYIRLYKIFCGHNILSQCTIRVKGNGGKHLQVVFMV